MSRCSHVALVEAYQSSVVDPGRMQRLITCLNAPRMQHPGVALFVGHKEKKAALRQFFPGNNASKRTETLASIYVDTDTISARHPLLFIDVNPFVGLPPRCIPATCHEIKTKRIEWANSADSPHANIQDLLLTRVVLPLADVAVIFADDVGGLPGVADILWTWCDHGSATTLPPQVRPRLVVISAGSNTATNQLECDSLRAMATAPEFQAMFSSMRIEHTARGGSNRAMYTPMRQMIKDQLAHARAAKHAHMCLFSAQHLAWLFPHTLGHFCRSVREPFDAFACFREHGHRPSELLRHVHVFVDMAMERQLHFDTLASVLASSILMEAYPPGAHRFAPSYVFKRAYRDELHRLFGNAYLGDGKGVAAFGFHMVGLVRAHLLHQFAIMQRRGQQAADLHAKNLTATSGQVRWSRFVSNRTCFYCFAHAPEHVLDCRHAVCDACVPMWGEAMLEREHGYRLRRCGLCLQPATLTVFLKPPTAGVRVISIDGGGVRGVVPLEFLRFLQNSFGSDCTIQEFFDLACGTSAGGLITLGLFAKQWPLAQCEDTFSRLTGEIFGAASRGSWSALAGLPYVRLLLNDALYKEAVLDSALQDSFGRYVRVFDYPHNAVSRYKFAVTATNITEASPFIFTNYNGRADRDPQCGYQHLRPDDVEQELLLWEAGRATSAAPAFFRTAKVPNVGTFQDGGLRLNNPVNVGLAEVRQVWSASTKVDVMLSLGTGTTQETAPIPAPPSRGRFKDSFIPRIYRSFMSGMDGEVAWRQLSNHLSTDAKTGHFRLNIPLSEAVSRLDDVRAMEALRNNVHVLRDDGKLLQVKRTLLASCFFFELDDIPQLDGQGFYLCSGTIRVRGDGDRILSYLREAEPACADLEFLKGQDFLGVLEEEQDTCERCKKFCKHVQFYVRNRAEEISILLNIGNQNQQRISGFPCSTEDLVHKQRLQLVEDPLPRALCICAPGTVVAPLVIKKNRKSMRAR
ncbi:hypothetical protein CKM354_001126600 [Cercospora kikuchii]|uniref:PNPLA domain-containing protein n=1 Tax=Cercospora kikuchii TaxID=84275 RepID=A0A9P3FI58_9PEZI|nr:uncharacterized protein CKM354_001126600 [Cercospora kikuchii]GIZ48196.1 hypothetical protein CKM354_001126600 [Cercospora kikuchii]